MGVFASIGVFTRAMLGSSAGRVRRFLTRRDIREYELLNARYAGFPRFRETVFPGTVFPGTDLSETDRGRSADRVRQIGPYPTGNYENARLTSIWYWLSSASSKS